MISEDVSVRPIMPYSMIPLIKPGYAVYSTNH